MAAATQSANTQAATSSPKDSKASISKSEGQAAKSEGANEDSKTSGTQPLAPPPKPSQNDSEYFGATHNNAHFSLEPNPFEQSFGNPSTETPSKFGGLPPVASLTSPAPLGTSGTPGWTNSLRSGPLSPAMLPGPTPSNGDYFDSSFRQSFPTPNESSLRSGLTPGGGGSMFPAPSPNSQAIFNSMQSGGATPGTLEFHRTAMSAAARSKGDTTSNTSASMHGINKQEYQPAQQQQATSGQNPFNNNSEHDAVNSLYMLANNGQRNANQFAMSNQQQGTGQLQNQMGDQSQDPSPTTQRGHKQSVGNLSNTTGMSENGDNPSDGSVDPKSSGKKTKKGSKANGRRKAEDSPPKGSAKKSKGNSGDAMGSMDGMDGMDDDSDDDQSLKNDDNPNSNKKLTDEEKRKNFLERNRVAALKCRQRKKQWLANLQQKVEVFTTENQELSSQNAALHEEVRSLKTLLMAHRDCPVSHQQGLGGAQMANILGGDFDHHNNPYGMSMSNNGNMMMQHQQGMQRR